MANTWAMRHLLYLTDQRSPPEAPQTSSKQMMNTSGPPKHLMMAVAALVALRQPKSTPLWNMRPAAVTLLLMTQLAEPAAEAGMTEAALQQTKAALH